MILLPVTFAVIRAIKRREPGTRRPTRRARGGPPAAAGGGRCRTTTRRSGFYRDELGLVEEEQYDADGGARVMILDAGRATLELSNPAQIDYIDTVETGRTGVSATTGWPSRWTTAAAVTDRLTAAGRRADRPADAYAVGLAERPAAGPGRRAADGLHRAVG